MKPLGANVLVKPSEKVTTTETGIYLGAASKKSLRGEIIAVGTGLPDYEMKTKVGETVLYHDHKGTEVPVNGVTHLLIDERSCIAVL